MSTRQTAIELTRKALDMLSLEESRHRQGHATVGTATQLESSRNQLEQMLAQLNSDELPPLDSRLRGMGHMVGDSWPLNEPLGNALLEAEQAYRKAK
jgi:hypothetical protein